MTPFFFSLSLESPFELLMPRLSGQENCLVCSQTNGRPIHLAPDFLPASLSLSPAFLHLLFPLLFLPRGRNANKVSYFNEECNFWLVPPPPASCSPFFPCVPFFGKEAARGGEESVGSTWRWIAGGMDGWRRRRQKKSLSTVQTQSG